MSVGFLGTLMARLTAARAALLDNLDTTISSRASGSYYTSARATKIDNLNTTISSRASATALATTDAVCDAIKSKTDAYLNASIATVDTVVDSIKSKVDTNLDATISSVKTHRKQEYLRTANLSTASASGTSMVSVSSNSGRLIGVTTNAECSFLVSIDGQTGVQFYTSTSMAVPCEYTTSLSVKLTYSGNTDDFSVIYTYD